MQLMDAQKQERFTLFTVSEESKNLIGGSSLTSQMKTENLANGTIVYSCSCSTTETKNKKRYSRRCDQLRSKTKFLTPDELINIFLEFNEVITIKPNPDMVAFLKQPPTLDNQNANLNIDGFKNVIKENFGSRAVFELLNLNSLMKNL